MPKHLARAGKVSTPDPGLIQEQVDRILLSEYFVHSERLTRFLRFAVEQALEGRGHELKEYRIGTQVFERAANYDTRIDPIVRVEAARLRTKLKAYYETDGVEDPVWIEFPKGSYAPVFRASRLPDSAGALNEIDSISVLPFADLTSAGDCRELCSGITEEIISSLLQIDGIRVVACKSGGAPKSGLVLQGSARKSGSRWRVTVRLLNNASGCYLWSETYERQPDDLFAFQDEVSAAISAALRGRVVQGIYGSGAETQAYNLYLIGRYHWNKRSEEGLRKSIGYFKESIRLSPGFALAYSALADAYCLLGNYGALPPLEVGPEAKAHALKAVHLDAMLPDAHISLAHVLATYDWNWQEAEKRHQHAMQLSPAYARPHHWYATDCLAPMGRLDEALHEIREAQHRDPISMSIARDVGLVHYYRGEYLEAVEQSRRALDMDPNFYGTYWILGLAYEQQKRLPDAIATLEKAQQFSGGSPRAVAALGHCYALGGDEASAKQSLQSLKSMAKFRYVSPVDMALVHLGLCDFDAALESLETACEVRASEMVYHRVDPRWAPLRSCPRFERLRTRLAL
jgi:TolB-like protein/Tfp pilus assembly protein PilF